MKGCLFIQVEEEGLEEREDGVRVGRGKCFRTNMNLLPGFCLRASSFRW